MPTPGAPEYNEPQIGYSPLPDVHISPREMNVPVEAFGGGQSRAAENQAVDQFGNDIAEIGKAQKQRADDTAMIDANSQTMKFKQGLLYGTQATDAQPATPGALNIHGKDAFGISGDYAQKFDDFTNNIASSLTPDQQTLYMKLAANQKEDLASTLEKHTYQETQNYNDEVVKNGLSVNRDEAVLNYNDPDKVSDAIDSQKRILTDNAQKKGLPPEELQAQLNQVTSSTYQGVIDRMLANNQDQLARDFYDQHKDEITDAGVRTALDKALNEGNMRGESQRLVDDMESKKMTPDQAQDYFKTIENPELRDKVQERYKNDIMEKKRAQQENQSDLFRGAYNTLQKNGSLDAVSPNVMAAMTPEQQESLQKSQRQLIEGTQSVTAPSTYYKLTQMAQKDPKGFQNLNLMQYQPDLSPSDFKHFANAQADAQKGDSTKLNGILSNKQIVDDVLASSGVDPHAKATSGAGKQAAEFSLAVNQQVQQLETSTGKKVTSDDVKSIAKQQMMNVTTGEHWYGNSKKPMYQVGPNDNVVIPPKDSDQITQALQKRGISPNTQNMREMYLRGLKSGG